MLIESANRRSTQNEIPTLNEHVDTESTLRVDNSLKGVEPTHVKVLTWFWAEALR